MLGCGNQLAGHVDFHFDGIARSQQKTARILETPFDIRNGNIRVGLNCPARLALNAKGHNEFVVLPVNSEDARQFHLRRALRIDRTFDLLRNENNLGIFLTL